MASHRKILLTLSILVVLGSLGWTASYGYHLRSESFRKEMESKLSDFFELPCDVGRIRGHTFSSRQFESVDLWLPDRRDKIFHCARAIWQESEDGPQKDNQLDIADGLLVLGTDRWIGTDYRQLLESGLSHDFEKLRLRRINMERFEIAFDRGGLQIHCRDTGGAIDMTDPRDGVATLTAYELNGHRVSQGVRIHARFTPGKSIAVTEMVLSLPEIPLTVLSAGTESLGALKSGRFAGTVRYVGTTPVPEVCVNGNLLEAELRELTASLPIGPFEGQVSLNLSEARSSRGQLSHLHGDGRIEKFALSPLAMLLHRKSLAGVAAIRVDDLDVVDGHLNHLALNGLVSGLAIEEWLESLGRGSASGRLELRINSLDIAEDQIKSADIELRLRPPTGQAGTIDRDLLLTAAEKVVHFSWPASLPREILPEKVSYVECGVRLLVRDNQLRILGTHGKNSDTILTVSVFGQPFGIVKEQAGTIDLTPVIVSLQERAHGYSPEQMRKWLKPPAAKDH